jgi:hypothetical protein
MLSAFETENLFVWTLSGSWFGYLKRCEWLLESVLRQSTQFSSAFFVDFSIKMQLLKKK